MLAVTALTAPAAGDACPECQRSLVSERQAEAWCAACEWNLLAYEAKRRRPELGWGWVDRLTHRVAYRLSRRQFPALSGAVVSRPGWGAARLTLTAGGLLFLVAIAGALFGGASLAVAHWPYPLAFVGLFLVLLAVGLRPRLGKLDKRAYVLDKRQSPALVGLVARVAAELGTRPPDVILVDERFNASCSAVGLRRTRVLTLGLPLWAALPPQQRVALIAHELGHFVNGDLRSGVLTWLPVRTLRELALMVSPDRRTRIGRSAGVVGLAQALINLVLHVLSGLLWSAQVLAIWVSLRNCQRRVPRRPDGRSSGRHHRGGGPAGHNAGRRRADHRHHGRRAPRWPRRAVAGGGRPEPRGDGGPAGPAAPAVGAR
jgi:heat shock protein HtpX